MKKKKALIITIIFSLLIICIVSFFIFGKINITLNGEKTITLNYNETYTELGATAKYLFNDINDISITGTVDTSKVGTYEITYEAKFANIKSSTNRTVYVVDKIEPTIELVGNETIKLYVGSKYNEPGYSANDEYDGCITDKVVVNNSLDINKAGTYKILYTATDSSNNSITKERTIEVQEKPKTTNTSGVAVLMYHFFYDKNVETKNDANWIEIHDFEEQMKYLSENNYYTPSWEEFIDYVNGKITLPEKSVIVTADDGNPSFFELAVPVCQKYNIVPTSFIVSSWTHGDWLASTYKNKGVDFQSHTYDMHQGGCSENHGGLMNCISYEKGVNDLKTSIADLEQVNKVYVLAYPYGDYNENVRNITKNAGIKIAFTTEFGKVKPGMDIYKLPRIRVSAGASLNTFISRL